MNAKSLFFLWLVLLTATAFGLDCLCHRHRTPMSSCYPLCKRDYSLQMHWSISANITVPIYGDTVSCACESYSGTSNYFFQSDLWGLPSDPPFSFVDLAGTGCMWCADYGYTNFPGFSCGPVPGIVTTSTVCFLFAAGPGGVNVLHWTLIPWFYRRDNISSPQVPTNSLCPPSDYADWSEWDNWTTTTDLCGHVVVMQGQISLNLLQVFP